MSFLFGYLTALASFVLLCFLRRKAPARMRVDEQGVVSFPIDTLPQMLAIPPERRERFLAELPPILRGIWEMADKYPLVTLSGCVWVDDNLGELHPNVMNAPAGLADAFATRPLDPAKEPTP